MYVYIYMYAYTYMYIYICNMVVIPSNPTRSFPTCPTCVAAPRGWPDLQSFARVFRWGVQDGHLQKP